MINSDAGNKITNPGTCNQNCGSKNTMNKKILITVSAIGVICLSALFLFLRTDFAAPQLSRQAIHDLVASKSENSITWSDFEKYPHKEIGSGNFVYEYPLTDGSNLYLSGSSLSKAPMYIYIIDPKGNRENILPNQ